MKIRSGFVSNSSSSSFICDVSGAIISGYDLSLRDAEMNRCVNRHCFSDEYLVNRDDDDDNDRYMVKEKNCPICQMTAFNETDVLKYLIYKSGMTIQEIQTQIRENFESYAVFSATIKSVTDVIGVYDAS